MNSFMGNDFLLDTPAARTLYHETAADMPILDYHCHLSPKEIEENRPLETISALWFSGDHYKWRLLRATGCPEHLVNGALDPEETFRRFAVALENSPGNPLYHWAHLELQQYFGIDAPLNADTAGDLYEQANKAIRDGDFRPQSLIRRSRVTALCTTDDPADDLIHHKNLKESGFSTRVLPTFRPDRALNLTAPGFAAYLFTLEAAAGRPIHSFAALKEALTQRMQAFHEAGCRVSDHSLSTVPFAMAEETELEQIFRKALSGEPVSPLEDAQYRTALLCHLGCAYARLGWVMELHIGALRNNCTRLFQTLGPDAGGDAMGDEACIHALSRLLDAVDRAGGLPRTVLFNLNPKDSLPLVTLMGCFQDGTLPGKLQYGPAWWFLDTLHGMEEQLRLLAEQGSLGTFIGMETDSRSFTSYARHTYFRRILCRMLGRFVEEGFVEPSMERMKHLVRGVCYENAAAYFMFE